MKKIFYVPGLLSATIIPVLFWYYGNQKIAEPITNIMDFGIPSKIDLKEKYIKSGTSFESIRNWSYKKIKVEPGKAKENSRLFVSEVKNLQKRNEKNTGIEFILDKNNTYGDFASLVNDMAIAKHETYGLDINKTGHFFVPVVYIDPNIKKDWSANDTVMIPIDAGLFSNEDYKPNFYEISKIFFLTLSKEGYYILFGFLIFLNISMLSMKERFQL